MPRYRLVVEYDGSAFVGWQRQDNGPSAQAALEAAVERLSGEQATVTGAGRTDAGVHALGQVAHFDLHRTFPADTVRDALNAHLRPDPVVVREASEAAPNFHARFSARARRYLYRILNRRAPPGLDRNRVWHLPSPLDAAVMREAAQVLVGHHDFTTFRAAECQSASPMKTLDVLEVERGGEEIRITAQARSFLHHQVRSMVGSLRKTGEGTWTVADLKAALEARDRRRCGPVAPPHGLYLAEVLYDRAGDEGCPRPSRHPLVKRE